MAQVAPARSAQLTPTARAARPRWRALQTPYLQCKAQTPRPATATGATRASQTRPAWRALPTRGAGRGSSTTAHSKHGRLLCPATCPTAHACLDTLAQMGWRAWRALQGRTSRKMTAWPARLVQPIHIAWLHPPRAPCARRRVLPAPTKTRPARPRQIGCVPHAQPIHTVLAASPSRHAL